MDIRVYDTGSDYKISVYLGVGPDPVEYTWGKEPPEGQTPEEYLAACKREALLLAELELQRRQPPQEIVLP